jgi:hypothetical protein
MTHLVDIAAGLPYSAQQDAGQLIAAKCGRRPRWCVIASYPKAERRAHAALHLKGFEPYLPLITYRWADRTWHTGPLFPGYLFVRIDLAKPWHPVLHAPGVFSLLATDGIPSPCPCAVIEALQATEAARATRTSPLRGLGRLGSV